MRCWWTLEQRDVFQLNNPCLVTASGEPLDHFGCRRVNLNFAGNPARLKVAFTILNVRRPILSVGSLLKHGHGVIFDRANPCLLLRDESTKSVHRVPVEARGNTFVVLGRMKHVQVRDLALQQWIADGRLTLQKVARSANAADLLTKHVNRVYSSLSSRNSVFYSNHETTAE